MTHIFECTGLTRIPLYDQEDQEIDHIWFISYTLQTAMGNYVSQYYAESSQLSEDPQPQEIEDLIMSLYGPEYGLQAGGNDQ